MGRTGRILTSVNWKYALGEILLIVIGILMAVQINNWNERRIFRNNELKLLRNLKSDLEKNHERFVNTDSFNIERTERIMERISLLTLDKNEGQLREATLPDVLFIDLNPVQSTFEQMRNTGMIYKLTNDSLKDAIIEYYRVMEENIDGLKVQHSFIQEQYNHKDLRVLRENHFDILFGRDVNVEDLSWLNDRKSDLYNGYKSLIYMTEGAILIENYYLKVLIKENKKLRDLLSQIEGL